MVCIRMIPKFLRKSSNFGAKIWNFSRILARISIFDCSIDIGVVMTREEMRYLLRRFRYIEKAYKQKKPSALITIGKRKERISIDEPVKTLISVVYKALEAEQSEQVRDLMTQSIREGKSDLYIFAHNMISKSTFYRIKAEFMELLFELCILEGIVLEEEIFSTWKGFD